MSERVNQQFSGIYTYKNILTFLLLQLRKPEIQMTITSVHWAQLRFLVSTLKLVDTELITFTGRFLLLSHEGLLRFAQVSIFRPGLISVQHTQADKSKRRNIIHLSTHTLHLAKSCNQNIQEWFCIVLTNKSNIFSSS